MSGGSLDYAYRYVSDAAGAIKSRTRKTLHVAFAKHLEKVSKALYELEYVISGDSSSPAEEESIRAVLSPTAELETATEEAKNAFSNLEAALKNVPQK